jgi:hypothetical protein
VKLARLRRPKITCSLSYAIVDLKQMQKYFGTQFTLGEAVHGRDRAREEY